MDPPSLNCGDVGALQVVWEDGERVFCRTVRAGADGSRDNVLAVLLSADRATPSVLDRLAHEYELRANLDETWALRPIALVRERGQAMLTLTDPGGEPLDRLIGQPLEIGRFLQLGIALSGALGRLHQRGLIHKDIKPANVLVNSATGEVRLTGFGIASRLPRERQPPGPPELVAGTLPYMAPEQTGRMNRSVDARSDLYALGVTFYEMLTGSLPFNAADAMEWIHCHIARQPASPTDRTADVPPAISAIVLKLLAKAAEDRYQTAVGLEQDLRRCLADWETQRRVDPFPLGTHDIPDRFLIPEKLYGRERDIDTLLAAFDRVVASGAPELALVSGYSGIGKSSVVNEIHKVLVPPRGLFAWGKFDQHKRDIPYATLVQAFQGLVRPLLGTSEAELAGWRRALAQALGPNGRLMTDLVPELQLIIGEQPSVPELPPHDSLRRFQLMVRRFIGVFARPQHPLALFLDDLQSLDAATLDVLEDLLTQPDVRHLLLIGAYRDNEVTAAHPLMRKLARIRQAGAAVHDIALAPLTRDDLARLIAESLHCEPERAAPLAQLVYDGTAGNPFFAIQFISSLVEEGLLAFDYDAAQWSWDLARIDRKGYADDVAGLMVGKLSRLPLETQEALQQLSCLGSSAGIATLCAVLERSEEQVDADLWEAIRQEFVLLSGQTYKFVHDRIQEAAYSLIPDDRRAGAHLRIGRLLVAQTPRRRREEAIFEIVNQLNRGVALIASRDEREQLAELNLVAGKRAKNSAAYASALKYFADGNALLSEDRWDRTYALAFALSLGQAECEYLCGDSGAARERLDGLSLRAANLIDRAAVVCLQIDLYTNSDRADQAIDVALGFFKRFGISWSSHPSDADVTREVEKIWQQLGDHRIEELVALPAIVDPYCSATLDVLTAAHAPANFTDGNLLALIIARMVNLSIERGNGNGSPLGYVYLGMILESRFGDYGAGFRFGRLGVDLVERAGLDRFKAYAYLNFGNAINPWTRHVRTTIDLLRTALDAANKAGHLTVAAYTYAQLINAQLAAGDHLDEVQRFAKSALAFVQQIRFGTGIDLILGNLGLIGALRGSTSDLAVFGHAEFDEGQFAEHLAADAGPAMSACWYWIRKLQACVLAGDHASAVRAAAKAESLLWSSPGFLIVADYHFYAALAQAGSHAAPSDRASDLLEKLKAHQGQIDIWAESCAENFKTRSVLVAAEIARIENRNFEAMRLYEDAIGLAGEQGFIQNKALANELAARFYAARGFAMIANAYLREARSCYLGWGADGKVRALEALHPHLREPGSAHAATTAARVEHLDFATVAKVSQAMSGEMVLERLIDALMRLAIEHAGAERGLLLLSRGNELRQEAEAITSGDATVVRRRGESPAALPDSIVHYAMRTREIVILDDASAHPTFSADPYVRERNARSILCLPLVNESKMTGLLYLENNLTPHVFTPDRIAALKLLALQAAISLENTYLYGDLAVREAKIRRLVDSNVVGIVIWDLEGRVIDANDRFLEMVGYDRSDLVAGRMLWTELTPPDLRAASDQRVADLRATGTFQPYEKAYFRKDGSRVPVLVGGATFDDEKGQGVAFAVDLSDRKRAEEAARESERRYREIQMELAHASRVATMGQLSASIAHEVSQPIAGAITNAHAALRLLDAEPQNTDGFRRALERIVRDGHRAGEVVDRVRALVKKAPPRKDIVDVNEAILDIVRLTQGEAAKHGVSVQTRLADDLPQIEGDRVQLQQVVLNLIMNAVEAMSASAQGSRHLLIGTVRTASDAALVAVEDSGPGIDPEHVDRIFGAFYTTKSGGLGMGLSICRTIIEAHGGELRATNRPRGARFEFTVPGRADR